MMLNEVIHRYDAKRGYTQDGVGLYRARQKN